MSVSEFLPEYQELFDESGVQGVIQGLINTLRLSPEDVFQLFVTDPDPVLQSMIGTDPDLNMFLSSNEVLNLLKSEGGRPDIVETLRTLPNVPRDTMALNLFMQRIGSNLLPIPPGVADAASMSGEVLKTSAKAVLYVASKTAPNSRLGAALRSLAAGLVAASPYSNAVILGGGMAATLASSQIWDGIQAIYTMWNSFSSEQKAEVPETMKESLLIAQKIEKLLKNAELKDKDFEMVAKLGKTLSAGGMSSTVRQMLSKEYELHALSVLKRQLQNVFNEKTPLYQFSGMALKDRATRRAPSKPSLSGYPSVIGIH